MGIRATSLESQNCYFEIVNLHEKALVARETKEQFLRQCALNILFNRPNPHTSSAETEFTDLLEEIKAKVEIFKNQRGNLLTLAKLFRPGDEVAQKIFMANESVGAGNLYVKPRELN